MSLIEVKRIVEPDMFAIDGGPYEFNRVNLSRLDLAEDCELARISYKAHGEEPDALRSKCLCALMRRELKQFYERDYALFFVWLGATITLAATETLPKGNPIKRVLNIGSSGKFIESNYPVKKSSYPITKGAKQASLSEIDWADVGKAYAKVNVGIQSCLILSNRDSLCSEASLSELFQFMSKTFDGNVTNALNKGAVAAIVCRLGDLLISSDGRFDDGYRTIELIFDPRRHSDLLVLDSG